MSEAYRSFLRSYRRRSGLTQSELAYLVGLSDGSCVSKFECLRREPDLKTAMACEVILQVSAQDLFPDTARKVELQVRQRADVLYQKLIQALTATHHDPALEEKMALLRALGAGREDPSAHLL